mmetsp:Transcript_33037/g.78074  ORF Transcript_33037/g.78074 Transcript_33037/m.78074 type:complete len:99 (+) Transcript_33037:500-796(+)
MWVDDLDCSGFQYRFCSVPLLLLLSLFLVLLLEPEKILSLLEDDDDDDEKSGEQARGCLVVFMFVFLVRVLVRVAWCKPQRERALGSSFETREIPAES